MARRQPSGPLSGTGAAIVSSGSFALRTGSQCSSPSSVAAAPMVDRPASRLAAFRGKLENGLVVDTKVQSFSASNGAGQLSCMGTSKALRRLRRGEHLSDTYTIVGELQNDEIGDKVLAGRRRSDGSEVIIKVRQKVAGRGEDRVWRNVMSQLLKMQANPYVLDIQEIVEDDNALYTVMPKCDGGELWDLLENEVQTQETECKQIIHQLLVAVGHLHENHLIHRDIKLDNVMFDTDGGQSPQSPVALSPAVSPKSVRLIDFDNCESWMPGSAKKLPTIGGTEGFIAPEALCGTISPQSDLWSIGVILYILMTRHAPFRAFELEDWRANSPSAMKTYNLMKQTMLDWDEAPWPSYPLARDLCQKLLEFKPHNRPASARQALAHCWFASPSN